jgi:transglutaminase-like putative cysteine protease
MQSVNLADTTAQAQKLRSPFASGSLVLLALLLAEVMVAARAIELEEWSRGASTLVFLITAGALCGFVIGRTRVLDLISHLWALMVGVGASTLATAYAADYLGVSFPARVRYLSDLARVWIRESAAGRQADDDLLFVAALGLLVWLVGYASAWFLFRRGWILPALVMPGMLIVISVTNGGEGRTELAMMYVLLALALAAVQVSRLRAAAWHRAGLAFSTIAWRASAIGGAVIGLLAVVLVWSVPVQPPENVTNAIVDHLDRPIDTASNAWEEITDRLSANRGSGSSFAQFDDQFEMGGSLKLGDDPVAVLQSDEPHYLAAQRYSVYDGTGWSSDSSEPITGDNGSVSAPSLTFPPNFPLYLPDDMAQSGAPVSGTVDVLKPTGPRLLTIETYLSASERANVTTSWRQISDQPFDLSNVSSFPIELQNIASLLRANTFVEGADGGLRAVDPDAQDQIARAQTGLAARFLSVRWEIDGDGKATTLYVTGWLPNYDDVDSISADQMPNKGDSYTVEGLESTASADQLGAAGTAYPDYISERYLELPTSVTEETRDLAQVVAGGARTPYEQAMDIQTYLRETYGYDESISGPANGQDAVDYFLFQEKKGYCEYFASAMVVMLRSLDVPARVVAGFREVPFSQEANGYLYTEKQAHTWVEVYFPDYGWIPFEPTPGVSPFDHDTPPTVQPEATETPEPLAPTPAAETVAEPTPTPAVAQVATTSTDDGDGDGTSLGAIAAIGGAVAAVLLTILFIAMTRLRQATIAPGERLYRRLIRASRRAGVMSTASTTPRELAVRLGDAIPTTRPHSDTITQLYRKELYGRQALTPDDRDRGEQAWRSLRGALSMRWLRKKMGRGRTNG